MPEVTESDQPVRTHEPADAFAEAYERLEADVDALASRHDVFRRLRARNGTPPLWRREASFGTLVRFILEQQVSLASANAAFDKLEKRIGSVTPRDVLRSTDIELKSDGFSRQKAGYVRGIADRVLVGELDVEDIADDEVNARTRLLEIRGIGPWTAACFLLFVSGDRDIWPTGDRALYVSMTRNLDLGEVPDRAACDEIAAAWAPVRSTAARMLWHDYLGGPTYVPDTGAGFVEGTGRVHP